MVPDRLWLDDRLQGADVHLWCALNFTARGRETTDASNSALAELVGLSERSVCDSLARLQAAGFIARTGRGRSRSITLHPEGDGSEVAAFGLRVFG